MTPRAQREAAQLLAQAGQRQARGRADQALALVDRALALLPGWPPGLAARGSALHALGRREDAHAALAAATAADPGNSDAWTLLGIIATERDDSQAAMAAYAAALDADPGNLTAAFNMGLLLARLGPLAGAVEAFRHVSAADPNHAEALHLEGLTLTRMGAYADALAPLERAVALRPDHVASQLVWGFALAGVERWTDAIAAYDRVLTLAPGHQEARSLRLQARRYLADWDGHDEDIAAIHAAVAAGQPASPFALLALTDDPLLQRRAAEAHAATLGAPAPPLPAWPAGPRLRLAYVSADFYSHATLYLMLAALEHHDHSRVEITAVNIGREIDDDWSRRLRAAVDTYLPAGHGEEGAIAAELRRRQIDLAVDLKGYTRFARPAIFQQRAAPVQVNWLGHPGTLGLATMDYILADRHIITADNRTGFSEAVALLPDCYQPNNPARVVAAVPNRAALGLPDGAMVYAAFNQVSKLTPDVFDRWLRILVQVPDAVLWMWVNSDSARDRLRARAEAAGVAGKRLIFAGQVPVAEHLARLTLADLFLDTLPYNAHTTASDALSRGVPVLTLTGRAFAGRVATSLVRTLGLDELAVADAAAYETLAVALGRDRSRLAALKARLAAALPTAALYDPERFARNLERAFAIMVERSRAGLPPVDFAV